MAQAKAKRRLCRMVTSAHAAPAHRKAVCNHHLANEAIISIIQTIRIQRSCEGVYGDGAAWVMADKELWTLLEGLLLGRAVLPRCAPARVKRLLGMPAAEGKGTLIKLSEEEAMYLSVALRVLTIYSIGREELLPSDKLRVLERGTARDPSFWQGESGEREEASVGRDDDAASDESLSEAMEPFHGEDEDDEELSEGVVAAQNQAPIEEADSEWRQREGACVAGRRGEELAEGDMGQGGLSPGPPLPQSQSGLVRLTVDAFWRACCSKDPSFPACYAAYHHCRAKGAFEHALPLNVRYCHAHPSLFSAAFLGAGWLPKSGLQYGADYMLYRAHPTVAHSEFVATVLPESAKIGGEPRMQAGRAGFPDWRDQQALSRLSLQVRRLLLPLVRDEWFDL